MKFEFILHRPGIVAFEKKTNDPIGYEPEIVEFEAASNTNALYIGRKMYEETGLGITGHFNVSRAS
jgi:hypothetical protein